ncbi:MAG: hypothetical protein KatS3mg002_0916 [Candidatus Woesearchaeota archaeon]|nr:MAG: hypothetical protein KatS3mg002_0916 [Candidatus Woesearchaeota archaeon]
MKKNTIFLITILFIAFLFITTIVIAENEENETNETIENIDHDNLENNNTDGNSTNLNSTINNNSTINSTINNTTYNNITNITTDISNITNNSSTNLTNTTLPNNKDSDSETTSYEDFKNRSLDIRYDNILCKIDYLIGQIDIIKKYSNDTNITAELLKDKEQLIKDKQDLKQIYETRNITKFNEFIMTVLLTDFNKTNRDIKNFKENYKKYINLSDAKNFKDDLKKLRDNYKFCNSRKTEEMTKLMNKYYKHELKMWEQIIKSMKQRNLETEEIERITEQLQLRLKNLENALNSGNQTLIEEQLKLMNQEHLTLWTKFHSGILNSYLNRIEPTANKYGRSEEVKKIKEKLKNMEQINKKDRKQLTSIVKDLKESSDEMKKLGKEIMKNEDKKNKIEDKKNGKSKR